MQSPVTNNNPTDTQLTTATNGLLLMTLDTYLPPEILVNLPTQASQTGARPKTRPTRTRPTGRAAPIIQPRPRSPSLPPPIQWNESDWDDDDNPSDGEIQLTQLIRPTRPTTPPPTIRPPIRNQPFLRNFFSAERQHPCKPCLALIDHRGYALDDLPETPDCSCRTLRPTGFTGERNHFFANNKRAYHVWPPHGTTYSTSTVVAPHPRPRVSHIHQLIPVAINRSTADNFDYVDWDINVFAPIRLADESNLLGAIIRHLPPLRYAIDFRIRFPPDIIGILKRRGISTNKEELLLFLQDISSASAAPGAMPTTLSERQETDSAYTKRQNYLLQQPVPPRYMYSNIA
jgi:hypothetical protein